MQRHLLATLHYRLACPANTPAVLKIVQAACLQRCNRKSYSTNWGTKPQNLPFPVTRRGPSSNTPMPQPTPHTIPNHSLDGSCTLAQLCHKVSIGYNGSPHMCLQNYRFPLTDSQTKLSTPKPNYLPYPWTCPTYHAKWHPYPLGRHTDG